MDDFVRLVAYITPYFLIPLTFKYGLGIFGNLAGMVNDRSRGFFDNQRKRRADSRGIAKQAAREGRRFAGGTSTNFRGRLNRGIAGTLNAPSSIAKSGIRGGLAAAVRSTNTANNIAAIERTMKENSDYAPWMYDDELNGAATETNNAGELRDNLINKGYSGARLNNAIAQVEAVRRTMNPEAFKAMTALQAIGGGTYYKDDEKNGVYKGKEAWAAVARASGNDDSMAAYLVAKGRSAAMSAGRADQGGAGFGTTLTEVNKMRDELSKTGNISEATMQESYDSVSMSSYESQGGATIVHSSMKPESVRQMAGAAAETVVTTTKDNNPREFIQRLASIAATQDALAGSSPEKAQIWADGVLGKTLDVSEFSPEVRAELNITGQVEAGSQMTIRQLMEGVRSKPQFGEMRREYNTALEADRGGGAAASGASGVNPSDRPGGPPTNL